MKSLLEQFEWLCLPWELFLLIFIFKTKTETIVEEKSCDYDDGEVTFKLPQPVKEHSSDEVRQLRNKCENF